MLARILWGLGIVFAVLLCAERVTGQTSVGVGPRAVLKAYGVFTVGSPSQRRKNADTPTGDEVYVQTQVVSKQTNSIEGKTGTAFGIQVSILNLPSGNPIVLRKNVKYPPMHLPDGSVSRGFSTDLGPFAVKNGQPVDLSEGYSLEYPYEVVAGPWTIEIWYGDQLLVSKTFQVHGSNGMDSESR